MSMTVLVAFDESPQATAALHHALSNVEDAEITVLHVNDPREWAGSAGVDGVFYADDAFERSKDAAEAVLEEAEEIASEYDTEVTTATEVGIVSDTIVSYAEEHDVDQIVLGSHGRRGLSRFLLGSVAERVVRRAPGTVTVVRDENPPSDS